MPLTSSSIDSEVRLSTLRPTVELRMVTSTARSLSHHSEVLGLRRTSRMRSRQTRERPAPSPVSSFQATSQTLFERVADLARAPRVLCCPPRKVEEVVLAAGCKRIIPEHVSAQHG
jgi:hypothetical protein